MSKKKLLLPDSLTRQLIEEVKKRTCLWDTRNEGHNNRLQMGLAWKDIEETLGVPVNLLKIKWKNIRDFYTREIKRGKTVEEYTGKWRWFESLTFLNIDDTRDPLVAGDSESVVQQSHRPIPIIKLEVPKTEEGIYCEEYQESMTSKEINFTSEDFDLMFLKSLAPYFKMLDPVRKLVVRGKMQKMLLNEIATQNSS